MLQKLEVALSVDAVVTAVRAYLERSIRELFAKSPASGSAPGGAHDAQSGMQAQLATLASWHAWLLGLLRHFKARLAVLVCVTAWRAAAVCQGPTQASTERGVGSAQGSVQAQLATLATWHLSCWASSGSSRRKFLHLSSPSPPVHVGLCECVLGCVCWLGRTES